MSTFYESDVVAVNIVAQNIEGSELGNFRHHGMLFVVNTSWFLADFRLQLLPTKPVTTYHAFAALDPNVDKQNNLRTLNAAGLSLHQAALAQWLSSFIRSYCCEIVVRYGDCCMN